MRTVITGCIIYLLSVQYISAQNWLTAGNAGLTNANFLGTTDQQALRFRTNNQVSGLIDYAAGPANTAVGFQTLRVNTGNNNAAFGFKTMWSNTSGRVNTAMGAYAMYNNTTGYSNVAFGIAALFRNSTLNNLVAIGDSALYNNNSGFGQNTAVGSKSMYATTTGFYNVAVGYQTMYNNTLGDNNTATGYQALFANSFGDYNTAVGFRALYANGAGYNTATGYYALLNNNTGQYNTAAGTYALAANSSGFSNTANGDYALRNSTGQGNTAAGASSLTTNTTGSFNTGVGYQANVSAGNLTNATAIGFSAAVDASNKVRVGNTAVTSIGGQVGWTTFSDGRYKRNITENVPGLSFINALRPVTYTVDIDGLNVYYKIAQQKYSDAAEMERQVKADDAVTEAANKKAGKIAQTGFVAQEVEAAATKLGFTFSAVDKPEDKEKMYGLRYAEFVVPLVKAVQELSKQNEELQKQITELKAAVAVESLKINEISEQQIVLSDKASLPELGQNKPNPFNGSTIIHYTLPQQYSSAKIVVYSKSGAVLKEIKLSGNGQASVKINASALAAGTYNYALYVDGRMTESKQMVLAK